MKLMAFLVLGACLHVSARGYSQITLSETNAPLPSVFKDLQRQSGYHFLYPYQLLRRAGTVTVELHNVSLEQALEACLKEKNLSYKIDDRTVVISQKSAPTAPVVAAPPPNDIHGRVTDSLGTPMAGASVTVKGTKIGTQTDANGDFVLKGVDPVGTVVVVSFTGYETREYRTRAGQGLVVVLSKSNSPLDEIQVIAYGTTTQRFSTGNVTTVKGEDIAKQPVNNPLLALEGRVPGLFITQTTGLNGGAVRARVQGQNSIASGNEPLIVIDGVPYPSFLPATGLDNILGTSAESSVAFNTRGNPLSYVNPSEIESVEILKDADATSIYGSRAANGAILITTKKGMSGRMKIDIDLKNGVGMALSNLKLLNTRQYLDTRYQAYKNDSTSPALTGFPPAYDLLLWDTTRYTNWQKVLMGGTAHYSDESINFSGGAANVKYRIGGTYHKETTVFPSDLSDQKASAHFNVSTSSSDQKFKVDIGGSFLADNNQLPNANLISDAVNLEPVAPPVYNPDGSLNWAPAPSGTSTWTNPMAYLTYQTYQNETDNLIGNALVSYSIIPGLQVKSSFGITKMWTNDYSAVPLVSMKPENRATGTRSAAFGNRIVSTWNIEPQISYKKVIQHSAIEGLIGLTFQENDSKAQEILGTGFNSDAVLSDIKSAPSISVLSTYAATYKYNALFGRINYNWSHKYIVDLTARRDGSSRFGTKNQFHNFWSAGGAWIFSEENFVKGSLPFLSFGKIKGSYGTTGNDLIADYSYLGQYFVRSAGIAYQGTTGLYQRNLPNPYIEWEETRKMQFGVDLGFLKDKILINATYARNRSSNQLLSYSLPYITGFGSITSNFPATVQNTSWEFMLTTVNIQKSQFNWTSSLNLTVPENKLVAFPNLSTSTYSNSLIIGQPLGITKVARFDGVNPQTGTYQYLDATGKPVSTFGTKDQTILINTLPKYYAGLQNDVGYKHFHLDFLLQYVKQIGPNVFYSNNTTVAPGVGYAGFSNQPVTVLNNPWRKVGDNATIQRYTANFIGGLTSLLQMLGSTAGYSDASYLRLKTASISWQIPNLWQKKLGIQNAAISVEGQNLITITSYRGMDPETKSSTPTLPPLRVIVVGLHVSF